MRERDEDDDLEETGSDLDQIIAILEKSEIDYSEKVDDEEGDVVEVIVDINDTVRMIFDEHGSLVDINPVPH